MGALPKALARRGHRVMVVVPRYSNYKEGWETGVRTRFRVFGSDTEVPIPNIAIKNGACACCATLHNSLVFNLQSLPELFALGKTTDCCLACA